MGVLSLELVLEVWGFDLNIKASPVLQEWVPVSMSSSGRSPGAGAGTGLGHAGSGGQGAGAGRLLQEREWRNLREAPGDIPGPRQVLVTPASPSVLRVARRKFVVCPLCAQNGCHPFVADLDGYTFFILRDKQSYLMTRPRNPTDGLFHVRYVRKLAVTPSCVCKGHAHVCSLHIQTEADPTEVGQRGRTPQGLVCYF